MAKEYLELLATLIKEINLEEESSPAIEARHFFSGAALYANDVICASLSPVGLAFKLPEAEVKKLIDGGQAKPLKYFPKGHVKKDYALFESPDLANAGQWKRYFGKAIEQV